MKLILDFTFIFSFLLSLLILFLLSKNPSKELHKKILQVIFVLISLSICSVYAYLHKIKFLYYITFIFDETLATIIGPLILIYIKSFFLPDKGLIKKHYSLFIIPSIFLITVTIPSLISIYQKKYIFNYIESFEFFFSLIIIYSLIYCFISLKVLSKAEKIIKSNYSNLEGKNLNWIKRFIIGSIIIICIDIISTFYEIFFGNLSWNTLYITSICIVILITYLGYYGTIQSKILIPHFFLVPIIEPNNNQQKKAINKYSYNQKEIDQLELTLKQIMQEQKPFLDENLSLKSLAVLLDTSDKKLSTLLNQHMNTSFYDYINGFRVNHLISEIQNPSKSNLTLLAIAFESGFNSKTSFNRTFKKVTGYSPSEYKKQLKN